jgi:hypothetical protein
MLNVCKPASTFKPLEVGNIKVQMMQEKEHTVYVYRMIRLFNKEVRALFNRLDIKKKTLMIKFGVFVT